MARVPLRSPQGDRWPTVAGPPGGGETEQLPAASPPDTGVSDFFTVIEVGGPDRIGLLFDITRTLADLRLDVHLAKVATYGGRVVDAFYVRDPLGDRIEDPRRIEEIERAVLERVPS